MLPIVSLIVYALSNLMGINYCIFLNARGGRGRALKNNFKYNSSAKAK